MSYYNLPIKKIIFKLIELSSKRDMSKYQNSFISSHLFVHELTKQLDPDYIFNIRDPKNVLNHYLKRMVSL